MDKWHDILSQWTWYITENHSSNNFIKAYINQEEEYMVEYPDYFTLDDTRKNYVSFSNETCEQNNTLYFIGIGGFHILVENNPEYKNIDDYSKMLDQSCKRLIIFQLPENFNQNDSYEAIRCEFDEVPKQAAWGYSYVLFHNGRMFSIDFFQWDWSILSMD